MDAVKEGQASTFPILTATEFESAMSSCIPIGDGANEEIELSDSTFDEIGNLLLQAGREEWSQRPRTYALLRIIREDGLMEEFVNDGFWDIAFPYTYTTLPHKLLPTQRKKFLESQKLVLTKAAKLEGGPHASFGNFRSTCDVRSPTDINQRKILMLTWNP
jgi:hypothetical protein